MVKKVITALGCISVLLLSCAGYPFCKKACAAQPDEAVLVFLTAFERAVSAMDTYKCVMTTENRKRRQHEYKVSLFWYKKPNLLRLDVLEGDKKGSRVVLNREGKIRGRNAMGLRKTMKPTDRRLKNIRGSTFLNASLIDKAQRLKGQILERGFAAAVEETAWEDGTAYHLHLDYNDPNDPVTSEDLWVDKDTFVILKNMKYEGDEKVSDVSWRDFEINIPIEDAEFML